VTVDLGDIGRALSSASIPWVAAALGLWAGFLGLRGWRWLIILRASAPHSRLGDAVAISAVGWGVNSVSPFKVGDLVRIAVMARRARVGIGESGATVVLERTLDVVALLALALLAAAGSSSASGVAPPWQRLIVLSVAAGVVVVVAFWLVRDEARSLRIWSLIASRLPQRVRPPALEGGASVMRGFRSLRSPGRLALAIALSMLLWLAGVSGMYAFFRALSPQLQLSTLLLALTLFIISQAISVTPGAIGTFELFYIGTLTAFGAGPRPLLTAAAVLTHGLTTVAFLAWGGLGALWLRLVSGTPVRLEEALTGQDRA